MSKIQQSRCPRTFTSWRYYVYIARLTQCLHTFTSKTSYFYIQLPQKLAIFTYICLINLLQRVSADMTLELSEANSEIRNETVFSQLSTISVQKSRKLSQVDCKTCPRRFLEAPEPSWSFPEASRSFPEASQKLQEASGKLMEASWSFMKLQEASGKRHEAGGKLQGSCMKLQEASGKLRRSCPEGLFEASCSFPEEPFPDFGTRFGKLQCRVCRNALYAKDYRGLLRVCKP